MRARDHEVAVDRGRRGDLELRFRPGLGHSGAQVHQAMLAELVAETAGLRVEGDEPAVRRAVEDAAKGAIRGLPVGDAAVGTAPRARAGPPRRHVEPPPLAAAVSVERDDPPRRRREVEDAVDGQRRALEREGGAAHEPSARVEVARVVGPGAAQPAHVATVDLGQGGVAPASSVAAVRAPVAIASGPVARRLRAGGGMGQSHEDEGGRAHDRSCQCPPLLKASISPICA